MGKHLILLHQLACIFVNCVPTLKFIFVVPIIFKPDEEELINPFILLISLPKIRILLIISVRFILFIANNNHL